MIEQDKAFFILPGVVNTPPPVLPAANKQVLGPFPATAEDLKIGADFYSVRPVGLNDLHIGDKMPDAGARLLGMGGPGSQAFDAQGQAGFVIIKMGQEMGLRQVFPARLHIAADRSPIANRVGKQLKPLFELIVVQQPSLVIEQFLELVTESGAVCRVHHASPMRACHCS